MADGNKSEQATPRQRQKARERGQVTRSRELSGALSMCAVAGAMYLMCGERCRSGHTSSAPRWILRTADSIEPGGAFSSGHPWRFCVGLFRFLARDLWCRWSSGLAQGGFVFAPEALSFKFERLSPPARLKQLFSLAALSTILKSLLPFTAIAWVGVASIRGHWTEITTQHYCRCARICAA